MKLGKYSIGIGDRFGQQGKAQLSAVMKAKEEGVEITPVWNKSYREHQIVGTKAGDVREEADAAVRACGWQGSYFVDADHVGLKNVDLFLDSSDFFTIDVAEFIGQAAEEEQIHAFVKRNEKYVGALPVPGILETFSVSKSQIEDKAAKYLFAVEEAGRIYRHLVENKPSPFVVEVSMDETDEPQSPVELFFILSAISGEGIPLGTIAPKFTGRFNKGVDYVGNVEKFAAEFEQDVLVVKLAVREFHLPANLKLSLHSGSDKFAIYGVIREALRKHNVGLHVKTAGTTWLEELIGLAEAGGEALLLAKEIYQKAYNRVDELCKPYEAVLDIKREQLPLPEAVGRWDGQEYASALRHDQTNGIYNTDFRQLLHVSYKIAAELEDRFMNASARHEAVISRNVTENIFERHIKKIFL